jgi:hypothetical protein
MASESKEGNDADRLLAGVQMPVGTIIDQPGAPTSPSPPGASNVAPRASPVMMTGATDPRLAAVARPLLRGATRESDLIRTAPHPTRELTLRTLAFSIASSTHVAPANAEDVADMQIIVNGVNVTVLNSMRGNENVWAYHGGAGDNWVSYNGTPAREMLTVMEQKGYTGIVHVLMPALAPLSSRDLQDFGDAIASIKRLAYAIKVVHNDRAFGDAMYELSADESVPHDTPQWALVALLAISKSPVIGGSQFIGGMRTLAEARERFARITTNLEHIAEDKEMQAKDAALALAAAAVDEGRSSERLGHFRDERFIELLTTGLTTGQSQQAAAETVTMKNVQDIDKYIIGGAFAADMPADMHVLIHRMLKGGRGSANVLQLVVDKFGIVAESFFGHKIPRNIIIKIATMDFNSTETQLQELLKGGPKKEANLSFEDMSMMGLVLGKFDEESSLNYYKDIDQLAQNILIEFRKELDIGCDIGMGDVYRNVYAKSITSIAAENRLKIHSGSIDFKAMDVLSDGAAKNLRRLIDRANERGAVKDAGDSQKRPRSGDEPAKKKLLCLKFQKGNCTKGDACTFAHEKGGNC